MQSASCISCPKAAGFRYREEECGWQSGFAKKLHLGTLFSCTIDWNWLKIPADKQLVQMDNLFIGE
jgi:hypothetical protein